MGIEGHEQADGLAKEGVTKHRVKLIEESRNSGQQSHKRNREEGEQVEMEDRRRSGGGRSSTQGAGMPRAKRDGRSGVQGLIELGPLLPRLGLQLPLRLFKVTCINL